jgi:hypothetical protein
MTTNMTDQEIAAKKAKEEQERAALELKKKAEESKTAAA